MEEFVDALTGGAIWGVGFGIALGLTRAAAGGVRPLLKDAMKSAVLVGDWVGTTVEQGKESIEDLYHEAQSEHGADVENRDESAV
jgi:hypothetical protein